MITVGFAGLPSSGKSTMVNALAGKRVLESGVCRTTTEVCLVGSRNTVGAPKWSASALRSDDGVEFCALDLPGMCDAEDTGGSFDEVTHEWASKCDVVVWVTDARTAFLTTHEARAYAALRRAIQEKADEDGTLYQFAIVLAKYDEPALIAPIEYLPGEIRTGTEDTTIDGHLERVERAFPGTRVVKFNAFARIETTPCSAALKALIGASCHLSSSTKLELKWAANELPERRLVQMRRALHAARSRASEAEKALVISLASSIFFEISSVRVEMEILPSIPADVAAAFRAFAPRSPLAYRLCSFRTYYHHANKASDVFALIVSADWTIKETVHVSSHMLHVIGPYEPMYERRPALNWPRQINMNIGDVFVHSVPRNPSGSVYPCSPHAYSISPNTKSFGICVNGSIFHYGDCCLDGLVVGRLKNAAGVIKTLLEAAPYREPLCAGSLP